MATIADAFSSGFNAIENLRNAPMEREEKKLRLEEAKLKLEMLKKSKADEEAASKIQTDQYNLNGYQTPTTETPLAPTKQNLMPGESGGMPTDKRVLKPWYETIATGPLGTGLDTSTPSKNPMSDLIESAPPTSETPELSAAPETTPMQKFQQTGQQVQTIQSKLQQVRQTSDLMHKRGLHKEADKYEKDHIGLEKDYEAAQEAHLKTQGTVYRMAGGLAQSYLDSSKVPGADTEALWQQTIMTGSKLGLPLEEARNIPADQRDAYASKIISMGKNLDANSKLAVEKLKQDGANNRAREANKIKERTQDIQNKSLALRREDFDFKKDKFSIDKKVEDIDTRIKESNTKVSDINNQINKLEAHKVDLSRGNLYYSPSTGLPLTDDPAAMQEELTNLNENIKLLMLEKESYDKYVQDLNSSKSSAISSHVLFFR
jgi:archaellum component FlaC